MIFGVQFDHLSGDNDTTDAKNRAFINNWEAVSDTYIVENEKYGELSSYTQNASGLQAAKAKAEVAIDRDNRFRLKGAYGYYRLAKAPAGAERNFGHEIDLTFTWQYTYNATFNLFGGFFIPDDGFVAVSPAVDPDTDNIWLFGGNLLVAF